MSTQATSDRMGGRGMANRQQQRSTPQVKPAVVSTPPIVSLPVEAAKIEHVEAYRRCPLCWERCQGVGCVYSTQGRTRYYKCKRTLTEQPPCGFTWTAKVEVVRVEHRVVVIDGQR